MLGACGDFEVMVVFAPVPDGDGGRYLRLKSDTVPFSGGSAPCGGGSRLETLAHKNWTCVVWIQSVSLSSNATDTEPTTSSFLIW